MGPSLESGPALAAPNTVLINSNAVVLDLNTPADAATTLFSTLCDLFAAIRHHPTKTGIVSPQAFILQLKRENELFRSTMHQDAHEFLNYLLNTISEQAERENTPTATPNHASSLPLPTAHPSHRPFTSWIHRLFQGNLTNETRCLTCETVTSRDESFLDLSIDIEEHTSLTACLRQFSASETLYSKNKFFCDTCCGLQEAEKRMKIKDLPEVLALHLKRFKWREDQQQFTKLSYRVVFPFELRLFNTVDGSPDADRLYTLWAVVVHIGAGLRHGHYVTIIKSMGRWLLFDDDAISQIEESDIAKYYGDSNSLETGYVLFYQRADTKPSTDLPELHHRVSTSSQTPRPPASATVSEESSSSLKSKKANPVPPISVVGNLSATRPLDIAVSPTAKNGRPSSPAKERKGFLGLGKWSTPKGSPEDAPAVEERRGSNSQRSEPDTPESESLAVDMAQSQPLLSNWQESPSTTTTLDSEWASSISSQYHPMVSSQSSYSSPPASMPPEVSTPVPLPPPPSVSVPEKERKGFSRLFGRKKSLVPEDDSGSDKRRGRKGSKK